MEGPEVAAERTGLPACEEQLGELDRVQRRALAQVVAGDPEVQRSGLGTVLANPPDQHRVDTRGVERRREPVAAVDDAHARRGAQDLDRLGLPQRAMKA